MNLVKELGMTTRKTPDQANTSSGLVVGDPPMDTPPEVKPIDSTTKKSNPVQNAVTPRGKKRVMRGVEESKLTQYWVLASDRLNPPTYHAPCQFAVKSGKTYVSIGLMSGLNELTLAESKLLEGHLKAHPEYKQAVYHVPRRKLAQDEVYQNNIWDFWDDSNPKMATFMINSVRRIEQIDAFLKAPGLAGTVTESQLKTKRGMIMAEYDVGTAINMGNEYKRLASASNPVQSELEEATKQILGAAA